MRCIILSICMLIYLSAGFNALAKDSCITSECHVKMGTAKYVHGPIAAGECTVCHVVGKDDNPPKKHDLTYSKEEKSLCLGCHEELEQFLKERTKHLPVE